MKRDLVFLILIFLTLFSESQTVVVKGKVIGAADKAGIQNVQIRVANTTLGSISNANGEFEIRVVARPVLVLQFHHLSFEFATQTLQLKKTDTVVDVTQYLKIKNYLLDTVAVSARQLPETLVGKAHYSIFDFDFTDHGILLLTAEKTLKKATLRFSDFDGTILSEKKIPEIAGAASHFFHDYQGYTDLVTKDSVFRISVFNDKIELTGIRNSDFTMFVESVVDTVNNSLLWTTRNNHYPELEYYSHKTGDSVSRFLKKISNGDLMQLYRLEYYYLPSRAQLEARRLAEIYKTDKHIVAALMSGFTNSHYYEPLFAPLFVLRDTICIFDHYRNTLFHYDKNSVLIDSVAINYHHPKRWNDWKKQLFVDPSKNNVWAYFSHDGRHYLKQINWQTGEIISTYKLQNHSAERIKVRDGYAYYVYRPFESTQEKFLYRERLP